MRCTKCNTEVKSDERFCPQCGSIVTPSEPKFDFDDYLSKPVTSSAPKGYGAGVPNAFDAKTGKPVYKSEFKAGLLSLIGLNISNFFLLIFTAFIATAWVVCRKQCWLCKNTYIDGRQLVFVGKGGELFVKWIVWMLLCGITCGIYSFWLSINMQKWVVEHTHFADNK